jgi:hypothetical protein
MTEKLDEPRAGQDQDLKRVSMVWPADLKEQVRQIVGSRGLTDFTLDAVRDKLATMQTAASSEQAELPAAHVNGAAGPEQISTESLDPPPTRPASDHQLDPVEVAKLPLSQRMAHARTLINGREPDPAGQATHDRCPTCRDALVNGECWTCPPSYASQA